MGCPFDLLADDATDLLQLLHQVDLGLQSSRSIEDTDIVLAIARLHAGAMSDGGRIASLFSQDDIASDPFGPDFELFDGGSAEGIPCPKQHSFSSTS
jgi:hypothetical protein